MGETQTPRLDCDRVPIEEDLREADKLDWEEPCKRIATLIDNFSKESSDPLTICIKAPWGVGKTWFLKMLFLECEEKTKSEEDRFFFPILVNAWKLDHSTDPLGALLAEIFCEFKKLADDFKTKMSNMALRQLDQEYSALMTLFSGFGKKNTGYDVSERCAFGRVA